ncbi:MAG: haloacid dehalogenase-like hydrolase [Nocardiopsaceae bacterium]|nr:haloacid dehalogenase-like hydrolase [Nocardiopsaceae bacterium]
MQRLVLWNIDLTLVDVAKVMRPAYAEAFRKVTGRPLVQLPQLAGRTEPEAFFDALARNGVSLRDDESERLVGPFGAELATALEARKEQLVAEGQLLPGAEQALAAVAQADGVVQSVLTGSSRPNAALKLRAFRLDRYLDMSVGGFAGSDPYPKGALLELTRQRAEEKYRTRFGGTATIYVADSPRDVEAASIAGAKSVAVASGRASSGELRDSGADVVLPDLTAPRALIRAITSPA